MIGFRNIWHVLLGFTLVVLCSSCSEEAEPILPQVSSASNVRVMDVENSGDPSDLLFSFSKAADESNILEYRVMVINTVSSQVLNVDRANEVESESYQSVVPNGNNLELPLLSQLLTVEGSSILEDEFYLIYILSVSSDDEFANRLSEPSNSFKYSEKSDPARSLALSDIGNSENASDFQLSFTRALDENKVALYRVIISKEEKASELSIEDALGLATDQYIEILPTGTNQVTQLPDFLKDADGDDISIQQGYRAVILSQHDGTFALQPDLSNPSNSLTLETKSFVQTLSEEFQAGGGLSYHPDDYLIAGNTNGSFRNSLGEGVVRIELNGSFSIQNTELENCSGNDWHPLRSEIFQVADGGVFRVFADGTSTQFAAPINIGNLPRLNFPTDVTVLADGRIFACNCDRDEIYELVETPFGFVSVNLIEYDNSRSLINCPRYMDFTNRAQLLIMNAFGDKILTIPTQSSTSEPTIYAQLPSGSFLSMVNVESRNAIYATTSDRRVVKINTLSGDLTYLAGSGAKNIVDGDLSISAFINPINITADPSGNRLYVLDETDSFEGISVLRVIELVD